LSAAIAHEIRNPLTSIAGSASLLSEMLDLKDEHRRLLQIVTRESERLNGIITDFLAYSRNKKYEFANVDLVPLLEDTLTLLGHRLDAQNTGIKIERHYTNKKAFVFADGDQSQFEGGTGLGLAIVYQIVQAHEGKVWVRSKQNQGCTFVLRLRRAAEEGIAVAADDVEARTQPHSESEPERLIGEGAHA
jgi:signal transduction histidine kinase